MATGIELVLGWKHKEAPYAELGVEPFELDDDETHPGNAEPSDKFAALGDVLVDAHMNLLPKLVLAAGIEYRAGDGLIEAMTPSGLREFNPLSFEFFYDPDEMGDDEDTAVFGIAVTGRYVPTLLDWENENGTLSPLWLNNEMLLRMSIIKAELVKVIPTLEDAEFVVIERHY